MAHEIEDFAYDGPDTCDCGCHECRNNRHSGCTKYTPCIIARTCDDCKTLDGCICGQSLDTCCECGRICGQSLDTCCECGRVDCICPAAELEVQEVHCEECGSTRECVHQGAMRLRIDPETAFCCEVVL